MTGASNVRRVAPGAALDAALRRGRAFLQLVKGGPDDVEKSLWGSPAGKKHLAKRIVEKVVETW